MRRIFLALSGLALFLVVALIFGGFGLAQTSGPVPDARPTPTPILPLPEWAPVSPESPEIPPLPDLIVTQIEVIPASPRLGQQVTIRVTIKNQSVCEGCDVPPGNNFWSDLYIDPSVVPIQLGQDGVHSWGCQATWVPAGGSHVLQWSYTFDDVKTFALYAQVDTDGHVQEANETNNVLGPFLVQVVAANKIVHQTHQDFQLGMASSLDGSHPEGVLRRGIFIEPQTEPGVYSPDSQVDHPPSPPSHPNNVSQVKPALTSCEDCFGGGPALFAVWEDGRNGGVYNRDIYFSRSTDGGVTWLSPDVRVNWDDPIGHVENQVSPDIVWDPTHGGASGRLYAAWQDGRLGSCPAACNYDIYFAYSDDLGNTWSANRKLNDDVGTAAQLNPSLAVGPAPGGAGPNRVYVVWQDQRNGNDDVYLARSDDGGISWNRTNDPNLPPTNYFVTDDPAMTAQNQVAPSVSVENQFGIVYVGWEDWRSKEHPEIYVMWSWDGGQTFGIDVPVTIPPAQSYRTAPSLKAHTTIEMVDQFDPVTGYTYTVQAAVSVVHVAWQQGRDETADVYYSYATYDHFEPDACPWPYDFCFKAPQAISGFVVDSAYVRPPEDTSAWPIEPSWQGQVTLDLVPDNMYLTYCHAASTQVYSKGVMIAWSDARSYDDWRYEIRTRRVASPEGDPKTFDRCEDQFEGMVNGNPKLAALRDDPAKYEIYKPAATGQHNPSIRVDGAGIWVVWDDDRADDPSVQNSVRNRDVFAARMATPDQGNYTNQGIYISPVLDGRATAPQWYVLSWWGATQHTADLLLQTRFGNNQSPPKDDVVANGWTRWTGNPSGTYLGCTAGVGCYYDAPGRHIVDPAGNDWFDCGTSCPGPYRYMQYKVIIRGSSRITALSQVTIHYLGARTVGNIYLPLIVRNH